MYFWNAERNLDVNSYPVEKTHSRFYENKELELLNESMNHGHTTKKSSGSNYQKNSAGLWTWKQTKKYAQLKQIIAVPRLYVSTRAGKRVRGLFCEHLFKMATSFKLKDYIEIDR